MTNPLIANDVGRLPVVTTIATDDRIPTFDVSTKRLGYTTPSALRSLPTTTEVVTATKVITAAESGATFFLSSDTEFVSTLPAPAAGLRFTFFVAAAPSGANYTIVTTSSANIIKGQVYTLDVNSGTDPDFETSGGDTISLVASKAVAGDSVELFCDGTNWFFRAFCSVFDAITITTAS